MKNPLSLAPQGALTQPVGHHAVIPHTHTGTATSMLPSRQSINIMHLPVELRALIMQQLHKSTDLLHWRATCQDFKKHYDRVYSEAVHQYHVLDHNTSTPRIHDLLHRESPQELWYLPDPYTKKWYKAKDKLLKVHDFPIDLESVDTYILQHYYLARSCREEVPADIEALTEEVSKNEYQAERLQYLLTIKTYIQAWNLLLQEDIRNNHQQASQVMKILGRLAPCFDDLQGYTEKLFKQQLSWEILHQLARIQLDLCIQLVAQHFSTKEALSFINTYWPEGQRHNLSEELLERCSSWSQPNSSCLTFVVEFFAEYEDERRDALCALLQTLIRQGTDLEEVYPDGDPALVYALRFAETKKGKYPPALMRARRFAETKKREYPQDRLEQLVTLLLAGGADCNGVGMGGSDHIINGVTYRSEGDTPLIVAASVNWPGIVNLLLQHPQIDINILGPDGQDAAWWAAENADMPIIKCLFMHPALKPERRPHAFILTLIRWGDEEAMSLLQGMQAQEKAVFLNQSLDYALKREFFEESLLLIKQYGAQSDKFSVEELENLIADEESKENKDRIESSEDSDEESASIESSEDSANDEEVSNTHIIENTASTEERNAVVSRLLALAREKNQAGIDSVLAAYLSDNLKTVPLTEFQNASNEA
jgi:hypothetical protein